MLEQNEARIYLAEKRGLTFGKTFKRFHTFNDELYFDESRKPFGDLKVLNEEILGAGERLTLTLKETTTLILLPLVGGFLFTFNSNEKEYIVASQSFMISGEAGDTYEIANPYADETISFLQIQLKEAKSETEKFDIKELNLDEQNQLISLNSKENNFFIGQYEGREEGFYQLKNPKNGLFVLIIEGAFEVQNRLLETKDALALWNFTDDAKVEFEALSNGAMILLAEIHI
ncbi:pirin [Arcicella rosea]|uniref:Quercetin 2,3-dioxygenase C-terminal cupin domain-containing protein n=1 Tax=Arcicella rosea TaxID=502909 RepID=A0A841EK28_9BACT|nr:pirin [Arcicella rosea]MBB6003296.1 hypothetical protein [Arcicella rosea]